MAIKKYIVNSRRGTLRKQLEYLSFDVKRLLYRIFNLGKPLDEKIILFEAYAGRSYACSPKAIYEEMLKDGRFDNYRFIWVFQDVDKHSDIATKRTKLVKYRSRGYYRAFAVAGTWVVNSMPPLEIPKRNNQVMVQCSHGSPFKRLRSDIVKNTQNALDSYDDWIRKNQIDTVRYDYFISPSRFTSEKFISAFQLKAMRKEDIVIETGYPRNDYLHTYREEDVVSIKQRMQIPADKKIILYAPTWRDDQFNDEKGFVYKPQIDFDQLRRVLGDEYVVLFRAHYLVAKSFEFSAYEGFVYDVSTVEDINEAYIVSDLLITDYSSVFFDYANLKRPIVFYMYDKEHYENDLRGLYLDLSELPGEVAGNQPELEDLLKDIPSYAQRNQARLEEFSKRFNYLDDGDATGRVIGRVWNIP